MKHVPESNLTPSEAFPLARARLPLPWLGPAMAVSDLSRPSAAHMEHSESEHEDDGPETWTGLPV